MRLPSTFSLIVAAAGVVVAAQAQPPVDTLKAADELAWRTLAEVSAPAPSAAGYIEGDTPFSWRLWWNSTDVYPHPPLEVPPKPTNTAGKFRVLPCADQSEFKIFFRNLPKPKDPCEVVWQNSASIGYIFENKLWIRERVASAAAAGRISFPLPQAVEMKTEWRQISDDRRSRFVVATDLKGAKRGLSAFHMMIHANPKWVFATFIHEDFAQLVTDAGAKLEDSFGASEGRPSRELLRLLADHHVGVLEHYRLIGTQIDFNKPAPLGNPLIEPVEQIESKRISCISCHSFAALDSKGRLAKQQLGIGKPTVYPVFKSVNFDFTLAVHAACMGPGCADLIELLSK